MNSEMRNLATKNLSNHRQAKYVTIVALFILSIVCVSVEGFIGDGSRDLTRCKVVGFPRQISVSVRDYRRTFNTPVVLKGEVKDDQESLDFNVPPITPSSENDKKSPRIWPCFDKMDKDLIKIALPVIGNFAINPLIGAVDLFWVNRMGNALAVAGQAAANQVFSSAFWFTSFLPSGKSKIHNKCKSLPRKVFPSSNFLFFI